MALISLNNYNVRYCSLLIMFLFTLLAASQNLNNYNRYIDSASVHYENPSLSMAFLDSIPQPIEEHIPKKLSHYYMLKSMVYDDLNHDAKCFQSLLLALKYAKKEKNYMDCFYSSVGLFRVSFDVFDDTKERPLKYLDEAKIYLDYLEEGDHTFNALIIDQSYAYYNFMNGYYEKSNNILLDNIKKCYKYIDKDQSFIANAHHQFALNYIELKKIDSAHNHIKKLKRFKDSVSVSKINFKTFTSHINLKLAKFFHKTKVKDSVRYYLSKVGNYVNYMNDPYIIDYYKLQADVNKENNNLELSKSYLDSIVAFQNKMAEYNVIVENELGINLLNKTEEIDDIKTKVSKILGSVFFLFMLLVGLGLFYYNKYEKGKNTISEIETQKNSLNVFKENHDKLAVKVHGLEEYISNLKDDIKIISGLTNNEDQKQRIKSLYREMHVNSSMLLEKNDSHYELVNNLNADFFAKLKDLHPQLNKSEIIICYYVYIGFSNKEIALILNISVRAVESKRYRISKKLNLNTTGTGLLDYLKNNY